MTRRRTPRLIAVLAATALLAAAGCSGSSLDDDKERSGPIKIGLMIPQTGVYQSFAPDIKNGWQLYLDTHGGKLGGHKVQTIIGDEGEGKATALATTRKFLDKDKVDVIVGSSSADPTVQIAPLMTERKIPFIGTGGRPSTLKDVSYIWHTSWQSRETGASIADHVRTTVKGPVYLIGPDYIGGYDQIGGFQQAFAKGGGKLANKDGKVTWTPFPATQNFVPYLNTIASSGAKAVYTFYAGKAAIDFVKQYAQSGLKEKGIPLYAAGFLTEGSVLAAEGAAADGVYTTMNYAANLDNAANREFAPAYQKKYGSSPTVFCVDAYDAAQVLDRAIKAAGSDVTSQSINKEIGKLGAIDSPRGEWRFGAGHSPIQPWYLRVVKNDGRIRANVVVQNLATIGS